MGLEEEEAVPKAEPKAAPRAVPRGSVLLAKAATPSNPHGRTQGQVQVDDDGELADDEAAQYLDTESETSEPKEVRRKRPRPKEQLTTGARASDDRGGGGWLLSQ